MRVDKISYQKIFPTGMMYLNHKIGVEIQVEEKDDWEECFQLAKRMVEKWNLESNPSYAAAMEYMKPSELSSGQNGSQPTITQVEKPIRDTVDNIIEDIGNCKELEVLKSYQIIAKTNSRIQEAYQSKLKSFE